MILFRNMSIGTQRDPVQTALPQIMYVVTEYSRLLFPSSRDLLRLTSTRVLLLYQLKLRSVEYYCPDRWTTHKSVVLNSQKVHL